MYAFLRAGISRSRGKYTKAKKQNKKLIEHSNHALAYLPTKPTPGPALDGLDELDAWGGATTAPSELERLNNTS